MPACPVCGHQTVRTKRNWFQGVTNRALLKCPQCGERIALRRPAFHVFGWVCICPKCGTTRLTKLKSADHVDAMTHNPLRRLLRLLGCPLYHCAFCRFQFRDWRRLRRQA